MQLPSSWHFLLLFVTSSIADWSLDSPSAAGSLDDPALQLRLDWNSNGITDGSPTSTIDGVPTFARVPQDENVGGVENVGEDPFEVASGCSPPPPGKRRRRVRRGDPTLCSSGYSFQNTPSQFKETTEQRRQQKPTTNPGTKKAPSANASPRRFVPQLSPEAEHLSKVFLPQENRPQSDDYTCRKEGYYIPVCAHEDSESLGLMGARYVNFLDPCYPFSRFGSCPPLSGTWCCQRVEIALSSPTEDLFAPFRQSLMSRVEISQALQTNPNPFKFIGISCILIPPGQEFLPAF